MSHLVFNPVFVWLLTLALGLGVYGLRLSFIQMYRMIDRFPPRVRRAIDFIPATILAALISPDLFIVQGSILDTVLNARVAAGLVAAFTAWKVKNMAVTILVGMFVYLAILYLQS